MDFNQIIQALREAAHDGSDIDTMWQNLCDAYVVMGLPPETSFYLKDWWEVNGYPETLDWVCAQWFTLPEDRWEKKFADKFNEQTAWRYIVKRDGDDFSESYYIQKYGEHDFESKMPTTNISWLDSCALANKRSIEMGLDPVYYFNEDRVPLTDLEGFDGETLYEDEKANGVRLPSKEEWINACLAGQKGLDTPWGNHADFENSFEVLDPYVVCYENSDGKLQPVGTKLPNQYGLFDMLGNVFEFTSEET
jgi:hypothetical protein